MRDTREEKEISNTIIKMLKFAYFSDRRQKLFKFNAGHVLVKKISSALKPREFGTPNRADHFYAIEEDEEENKHL